VNIELIDLRDFKNLIAK